MILGNHSKICRASKAALCGIFFCSLTFEPGLSTIVVRVKVNISLKQGQGSGLNYFLLRVHSELLSDTIGKHDMSTFALVIIDSLPPPGGLERSVSEKKKPSDKMFGLPACCILDLFIGPINKLD